MGFVFPRLTFANDVYNPPLATLPLPSPPQRIFMAPQPRGSSRWGSSEFCGRSAAFTGYRQGEALPRTLRKTTGMESATRRSGKLVPSTLFLPLLLLLLPFPPFPTKPMGYPPFREEERGKGEGLVWRFTMRIEFHNRATRAQ